MVRRLFTFPNPVNEVSARLVAGGVVVMCLAAIVLDQPWLTLVIAYGFVARVLTGPTLSPLGQLVTRVVTPRLRVAAKLVPGPPKRFDPGVGLRAVPRLHDLRLADAGRSHPGTDLSGVQRHQHPTTVRDNRSLILRPHRSSD